MASNGGSPLSLACTHTISLSLSLSLSHTHTHTSSPRQTAGILRAWFASRIALAWNKSTVERKRIRRVTSEEGRPNASTVRVRMQAQCAHTVLAFGGPSTNIWHVLSTLLCGVPVSIGHASTAPIFLHTLSSLLRAHPRDLCQFLPCLAPSSFPFR